MEHECKYCGGDLSYIVNIRYCNDLCKAKDTMDERVFVVPFNYISGLSIAEVHRFRMIEDGIFDILYRGHIEDCQKIVEDFNNNKRLRMGLHIPEKIK